MFVSHSIAVVATIISFASAYSDRFYTASVFEHVRKDSADPPETVVQTNLECFKTAARAAKLQGADMIVFPEYGIFPPANRTILKNYLEYIPDPKSITTNPCLESEEYSSRHILHTLSCIARNNSIVVVANTGDIQPCDGDEDCPDDGVYHFNTNIAFDSDGTLIGRYHKERLFFEAGMDLPKEEQDPTFNTRFGKFGMFICFDIVFKKIAEVAKQGVEAILLPTMWIDPAPFMTSVQIWQSFAIGNNVTFMAANIQLPGYQAVGSGIFNGKNRSSVYTFNPDGISKLITAKVPRSEYASDESISESSIIAITVNGTEEYKNDGSKVPNVCSSKILGEPSDIYTDYRCMEENTSNYTFIKLNETEGFVEACNNDICCSLNYTANSMDERYYLGVYNGVYNMYNRYFWCQENCLLARCEPYGENPCATFPLKSSTTFQQVQLSMNVSSKYVYPSVVSSNMRLVPTTEWKYDVHQNMACVNYTNLSGQNILVVGLNGRCFDYDPPYVR